MAVRAGSSDLCTRTFARARTGINTNKLRVGVLPEWDLNSVTEPWFAGTVATTHLAREVDGIEPVQNAPIKCYLVD